MNRRDAYMHMLAAHAGQLDKVGEPYIFHPIEVEAKVAALGEDFSVVAFLHDVQEDTDYDLPLVGEPGGLTLEQVMSLDAITRAEGERYSDYIRRVKDDFVARVVKIADLRHNLSPERMDLLHAEEAASLLPRYRKSLEILESSG